MTDQTKAVVAAAEALGTACQEVERIGQYIQKGLVPSPEFVAPRLQKAQEAREKMTEVVGEVVGAADGETYTPPRNRPRAG